MRVLHKRNACIGCDVCTEVAPAYWRMHEDGMAQLRSIKSSDGPFDVAQGFEDDVGALEEAEQGCPVQIIRIE